MQDRLKEQALRGSLAVSNRHRDLVQHAVRPFLEEGAVWGAISGLDTSRTQQQQHRLANEGAAQLEGGFYGAEVTKSAISAVACGAEIVAADRSKRLSQARLNASAAAKMSEQIAHLQHGTNSSLQTLFLPPSGGRGVGRCRQHRPFQQRLGDLIRDWCTSSVAKSGPGSSGLPANSMCCGACLQKCLCFAAPYSRKCADDVSIITQALCVAAENAATLILQLLSVATRTTAEHFGEGVHPIFHAAGSQEAAAALAACGCDVPTLQTALRSLMAHGSKAGAQVSVSCVCTFSGGNGIHPLRDSWSYHVPTQAPHEAITFPCSPS
jgi:hypothetical protein